MEEKEKKVFFDELYQLDDESDGAEDNCNAHVILANSKLPTTRRKARIDDLTAGSHSIHRLGRTVSAPIGQVSVSFPGSTAPAQVTHNVANPSRVEAVQVPHTSSPREQAVGIQADMTTKAGKKRKRGHSFDALPDSQQIFKNLSFFFFPNNDVAPARAFRIRKAMEWGAVWIKVWKEGITHIIVDRKLSYKDLLTFLKIQGLPREIVLVNEDYPADCIRFRYVVNPLQPQYRVAGHAAATETPLSKAPATPSKSSLQLKREKDEMARLLQTPSRADKNAGAIPASSDAKSNTDLDVTHILDSMPSSMGEYTRDALSEAIEEAQAVEGLVGPPISYHVSQLTFYTAN